MSDLRPSLTSSTIFGGQRAGVSRWKSILLRWLASPRLGIQLSLGAALFLSKELVAAVLLGSTPRALSLELVWSVAWFLAALAFLATVRADEFVRRLTLTSIREPLSYFHFVQQFVLARTRSVKVPNPVTFLREIEELLHTGTDLLQLHHTRSVASLLGVDYLRMRDVQRRFEDDNPWGRSEHRSALAAFDANVEVHALLTRPLADLERRFVYSQNSYWDNLLVLASVARDPSYDRALESFVFHLTAPITRLAAHTSHGLSSEECRTVLRELHDILAFFRHRGRARVGFPLFDAIDRRRGQELTRTMAYVARTVAGPTEPRDLSDEVVRGCLSRVLTTLGEFERQRRSAHAAFEAGLQAPASKILDSKTDVVCLYGYSRSVTKWLTALLPDVADRRRIEVALIRAEAHEHEHVAANTLRDVGFSNLAIYDWQDVVTVNRRKQRLNFLLGIEAIDVNEGLAILPSGGGQLVRHVIRELGDAPRPRTYLIGLSYQNVPVSIMDPSIDPSSVLEIAELPRCEWISDETVGRLGGRDVESLQIDVPYRIEGGLESDRDRDDVASFYRERQKFLELLPVLRAEYEGQFVAVHHGRVVDSDASSRVLTRRFFERFGDTHVYIGYVGSPPPVSFAVTPFPS